MKLFSAVVAISMAVESPQDSPLSFLQTKEDSPSGSACAALKNLDGTISNLIAAVKMEGREAALIAKTKGDACSDSKKEKTDIIEKSKRAISQLTNDLKDAEGQAKDTANNLQKTKTEIVDADHEVGKIEKLITAREQRFTKDQKEINKGISELRKSINEARKAAAKKEESLAQMQAMQALLPEQRQSQTPPSFLQTQSKMKGPSEVEILEGKMKTMEKNMEDVKVAFDKKMDQLSDTKKAADRRKRTLEGRIARYNEVLAQKEERVAQLKRELGNTKRTKGLTETLLSTTEDECDQFSDTAKIASNDYSDLLKEYAKAKKQLASVLSSSFIEEDLEFDTHSFVQESSETQPAQMSDSDAELLQVANRAEMGVSLESSQTAATQAAAQASGIDPMADVKRMIEGFIGALKAESASESGMGDWCDKQKDKNRRESREGKDQIDLLQAEIRGRKAAVQQLKDNLRLMDEEIAEMRSEQNRVTQEMIDAEKRLSKVTENHKMMDKILGRVVTTLRECLDLPGTSLLQVGTGLTSKQSSAVDLVNQLINIQKKTKSLTSKANAGHQGRVSKAKDLQAATDKAIAARKREMQDANMGIAENTDMIAEAKDNVKGKTIEMEQVVTFMDNLAQQCGPQLGNTFEEVQERRKNEIESLQDALKVLEGEDIPV
mmetsp:Transcript_4524/g.10608  ORF Transcript_4524/g.10608 Transcript_4524/m.10608 type:complete len:664 (+) Transcript_4524:122-2113(+)